MSYIETALMYALPRPWSNVRTKILFLHSIKGKQTEWLEIGPSQGKQKPTTGYLETQSCASKIFSAPRETSPGKQVKVSTIRYGHWCSPWSDSPKPDQWMRRYTDYCVALINPNSHFKKKWNQEHICTRIEF